MKIPSFDYTKREWDKFKAFHNHLGGPFYLLETGEIFVDEVASHHADRHYDNLNVSIINAYKRKRGEQLPKPLFFLVDPFDKKPINPKSIVNTSQYLLIDYDTKQVSSLSGRVHSAPDYLRKHNISAYSSGRKDKDDKLEDVLFSTGVQVKLPKKLTNAQKEHIKDIVAASKMWVQMDAKVMRRGTETYYDSRYVRPDRVEESSLFTADGASKPFGDIGPEIRVNVARLPLLKSYTMKYYPFLIYTGTNN